MKNRELKFRAWDEVQKEMSAAYSFDEILLSDQCSIDGAFYTVGNPIMQYTGLSDKNGKDELYQDDIVNVHYFYFDGTEAEAEMEGVLGWREFGLTLENIKGKNFESHTGYDESEGWIYLSNWSGLHEESFTLLGNIHENPEKLK